MRWPRRSAGRWPGSGGGSRGAGEGIIRNLAGFEDENDATLDERWLRDAALRLAVSVDPLAIEAKTYAERLRKHVEAAWPRGLTGPLDLGTVLRAPPQSKWLAGSDADQPPTFAWGSIHSVKGREFPAAVLVLPKKLVADDGLTALDHWERGSGPPPSSFGQGATSL